MTSSWHWGPINDLRTLMAYLKPQHTIALIRTNTEVDSVLSSFPHWAVIDPCLIECRYSDLVFTSEPWIDARTAADTQSGQVRSTAEQRSRLGYSALLGVNITEAQFLFQTFCTSNISFLDSITFYNPKNGVMVEICIVNEKEAICVKLFLSI